jgi:hypothetical protein
MATYNKYRHTTIKGELGTTWYVEIHKEGFSGTSTEMTLEGEGFEVTWNGQGSTRDRIFLGSECVLNFIVQNDDDEADLYDILDSGFKKYFIRVYKNFSSTSGIWWFGWIQPGFDVIENSPYPYTSRITSTDSYGYYDKQGISFFDDEDDKQDNYNIARVFSDFIQNTNVANTNLVVNPNFDSSTINKGWDILSNDTISGNLLNINGQSGTRKPLSCEGNTLIPGEKYGANIKVTSYTTGTLIIKDGGGSSATLGTITSTGVKNFNWVQSDNSTQSPPESNGFRLFTNDGFTGVIEYVSVYSREDVPLPYSAPYMKTAIDWHTAADASSSQDDAQKYYICKGAFANNSNFPFEYKESDAFKEALKIFNCVGFLSDGSYNFMQPNHYVDNTAGTNTIYKYYRNFPDNFPATISSNLTIDQSNNRILGGSSFTYEAPFKSVSTTFKSVSSAFFLPSNIDITDPNFTYGGQIIADQDYKLEWDSTYIETIPEANFTLGVLDKFHSIFQTFNSYITIKATSSSGDKYLTLNANGLDLEWSNTEKQIVLSRGLLRQPATNATSSVYSNTFNESTVTGALKNAGVFGPSAYLDYKNPDNIIKVDQPDASNNNEYKFRQHLKFNFDIPQLADTSNIFIKVDTTIDYRAYNPGGRGRTYLINPNTQSGITKNSTTREISLEVEETTSAVTNEARYTESQSSNTATESFELSDVKIGVTETDATYALTDINNESVTALFQRGSDTAGAENFTQLLVKEFLELQKSPLKILQADIQSNNISPRKIIKYSLNDDGVFDYYMFLGGTLKAESEIMSGEWFRIKGD